MAKKKGRPKAKALKFQTKEQQEAAAKIRAAARKAKREADKQMAEDLHSLRLAEMKAEKDRIDEQSAEYWKYLYALRKQFRAAIAEAKAQGNIPQSTKLKAIAELPEKEDSVKNKTLVLSRRFGVKASYKAPPKKSNRKPNTPAKKLVSTINKKTAAAKKKVKAKIADKKK